MARLTAEQRQRAGDAVQIRRAELGLTQQELTRKANVASDRVGVIERAEEWPQTRTRYAIESALGWKEGALIRIARGESRLEEEARDATHARSLTYSESVQRILQMDQLSDAEKADLISQIPVEAATDIGAVRSKAHEHFRRAVSPEPVEEQDRRHG